MEEEPRCKKFKLQNEMSKYEVVANYISRVRISSNNLQAILCDELSKSVDESMIIMYAGGMKTPKDISRTVLTLNKKLPLDGLSHLKRVCNGAVVLLCPKSRIDQTSIQDFVECNIPELKDIFQYFKEVAVPIYQPKLKKQYEEVKKKWPCNFHPDAYLESLCGDEFFSTKELQQHRLFMAMTFEVVIWYCKLRNIEAIDEDLIAKINVTVIVDPSINSIVAVAVDNSLKHPVQHSSMAAIDNVAKTQYGGAWNAKVGKAKETSCSLDGIDKGLLEYLTNKFPNIKFGAQQYISKKDLQENELANPDGPYLCTNYYVYTLREPCLMCAMALVHARAKRVFFCFDNPDFGALKSKTKLHTVASLNHRYEVFTSFL